jgi:large subunit ribosomal protein L23
MIDLENVFIAPVLSEKTNRLREKGKYVFRVNSRATKIEIKEACRRLWDVHPVSCAVINVAPKPKRQRYKKGYTSAWKKAIVTLPDGEKIAVFEGV